MGFSQFIGIFFLSTVKFMFAPGVAAAAGYTLFETILVTSLGGISGITFFYFFGHWMISKIESWRYGTEVTPPNKKVFTRRNKFIVKLKGKYGLIGLILLTPSFLSIPIGSVVAAKFYFNNKFTYPMLLISTVIWSTGLSYFSHSVKTAIISI